MTIAQIKAANKAAGHNFFSRDTMKFFNSHIEPRVYSGIGGTFFVTSEKFQDQPRTWKVRRFEPTGRVYTEGGSYHTKANAQLAAKGLAQGWQQAKESNPAKALSRRLPMSKWKKAKVRRLPGGKFQVKVD